MSFRVCSAYRMVSTEGVGVIAGISSIALQIIERRERYMRIEKKTVRANVMTRWQEKWRNGVNARWTHRLILDILIWLNKPFGEVDYYLTQTLSGLGSFRKYLYNRCRSDTSNCSYCQEEDDAEHTLFNCDMWEHMMEDLV